LWRWLGLLLLCGLGLLWGGLGLFLLCGPGILLRRLGRRRTAVVVRLVLPCIRGSAESKNQE
jgi:hypothetical protein